MLSKVVRSCGWTPTLISRPATSMVAWLRLDRLSEAGLDQAEGDAIDVDLVASPLLAKRAREADQRSLGGGIAHLSRIAVESREREILTTLRNTSRPPGAPSARSESVRPPPA